MTGSGISPCCLCSWVKKKESAQPSEREGADWQDVPVAGNRSPGAGLPVIEGGPSGRRHVNIHKFQGFLQQYSSRVGLRLAFAILISLAICK